MVLILIGVLFVFFFCFCRNFGHDCRVLRVCRELCGYSFVQNIETGKVLAL